MHTRPFKKHGQRPKRNQPQPLDPSLLVNKAVEITQQDVYIPQHQFTDFPVTDILKNNIVTKGYVTPSPIQDKIIPHILEGKDVVGIANTGTGKTAAFLIPLIHKVFQNSSNRVLIVAPTRELALQIQEECKKLSRGMNIHAVLTIGGASMHHQSAGLRKDPQFVIGTPGRLKDFVQNGILHLQRYNNIVLDEVDRMMDMGFIHDMTFLISRLPVQRQSLFFSATIPQQAQELMHRFLKDPVTISVKTQDTAEAVEQDIIKVNGRKKIDILHDLLAQEAFKRVLVFGRTKWGIQKLAKMLEDRHFRVAAIHGNKSQGQRQRALEQFKRGEIQILLATDVASRGLDIEDVTHVINYDLPGTYEDYIHRIGRTGRANKRGIALSFID